MLGLSVTLCVVGMVYAVRQRRETQRRIDTFLESFREKEKELRALQERYMKELLYNLRDRQRREGRAGEIEREIDKLRFLCAG